MPSLFLAYYYQGNGVERTGGIARAQHIERHFLTWHRRLYDTLGLYNSVAELEDEGGITWLGAEGSTGRRQPLTLPATSSPALESGS
jgi:hypothetical protein